MLDGRYDRLLAMGDCGFYFGNFLHSEGIDLSRSGIFVVSRIHSGLPYGSHQTTAEDHQHSMQVREGPSLPPQNGFASSVTSRMDELFLVTLSFPGRKLFPHALDLTRSPADTRLSTPIQRAKEIGLDPPFAQRVDFERLWREAELPFKLCIGSPMDVPNLDTVFEAASSQRTVVYRSRSISTIRI